MSTAAIPIGVDDAMAAVYDGVVAALTPERFALVAIALYWIILQIAAGVRASAKSTKSAPSSDAATKPIAVRATSAGSEHKSSIPVTPPSTPSPITIRKASGSPPSPTEIVLTSGGAVSGAVSLSPRAAAAVFRAPPHHTGAIHLVMGPMFSGKTRELKRRIDVKRIASARKEMKCLLIKYRKDTRYDAANVLVTHNHIKDHDCVAADSLSEVESYVKDSNFVFIDEGEMTTARCVYLISD